MTSIEGYARYAIFWAPPAGSGLARFGAAWLGWDAETGRDVALPALALPRPLDQITRTPRRYSFHGTLKPPFRLATGTGAAALDRALAGLAADMPPATAPGLAPSTRLGFLALMPGRPGPGTQCAGRCLHAPPRPLPRCIGHSGTGATPQPQPHPPARGKPDPLGLPLRLRRFPLPPDPQRPTPA